MCDLPVDKSLTIAPLGLLVPYSFTPLGGKDNSDFVEGYLAIYKYALLPQ